MADHIQIGDIAPRIHYAGDGATVAFTYPFPIFQDEDIAVYVDGTLQTLTTHYSVSGAGESAGGSVTFVAAPEDGAAVALVRELTFKRLSDFQASGEFRAKVINDELDFQVAALQQLADHIERSVRLASSDTGSTLTLPAAADRAGRVLAFDGNGNLTTALPNAETYITMTAFAETLLDDADAAVARATLGAQAADAALSAIASLTPAEGQVLLYTGGAWSVGRADGADQVARDMAASVLAYTLAQNDAVYVTGSVGSFNLSDDFESDSLTTATNATYDANGDYYHNAGGRISGASTIAGTHTSNVNDGNDGTGTTAGPVYGGSTDPNTNIVAKLDLGSVQDVYGVYIHGLHYTSTPGGPGTGSVGYSEDNSSWTWESAITIAPSDTSARSLSLDFTGGPISARYVALGWNHGYSFSGFPYRVNTFDALQRPPNITLKPDPVTLAVADPTDVIAYFVLDPQESVTYGVDIVGKVSIDGGSTWATGTWAKVGDIGSAGEELYRLETDVSTQSGTSLVYQIDTVNNKEVRLHACVGLVAIY